MIRTLLTVVSAFAALTLAAVSAQAQPRPTAPAAAAGERMVPVGRVFPYLERFYGIPAARRTLFHLGYALRVSDRPYSGPAFFVSPSGQRTPVPIGPGGIVGRLPTLQQLRNDQERFAVVAPQGAHFAMNLQLIADVPLGPEIDVAALNASIAQANAGIRSAAGMMSFMAPTMVRVAFEGGRGAVAVMQDGSTQPLPVVLGEASFTPSAMPRARVIRFAGAPRRATLGTAPRR